MEFARLLARPDIMLNSSSKSPAPDGPNTLIDLTQRAYELAIAATQSAADLILGARAGIDPIVEAERELDELDREIDERVATDIAQAPLEQVREKLACLKCMIDLERVGDLLLSFATRADTVHTRLDTQDLRDFGDMLAVLSEDARRNRKRLCGSRSCTCPGSPAHRPRGGPPA